MKFIVSVFCALLTLTKVYAFNWQDLWETKNQQAQKLMDKGQYSLAEKIYTDAEWNATAAFRAHNYQKARDIYSRLNSADGYYNQGNAEAYLGHYKEAIAAYNKALSIEPKLKDAVHNRQIIEELLKKQQQQPNNNQDSKNSQQNKNQTQDNNSQKKAEQNSQESKQSKPQNKNSEQDKNPKQDKSEQDKNSKADQNKPESTKETDAQAEERELKNQWLRLIPDDPGGLLREKFLRDYMKNERV